MHRKLINVVTLIWTFIVSCLTCTSFQILIFLFVYVLLFAILFLKKNILYIDFTMKNTIRYSEILEFVWFFCISCKVLFPGVISLKVISVLEKPRAGSKLRPKSCCPSLSMVTSLHEWNIFERDVYQFVINQSK